MINQTNKCSTVIMIFVTNIYVLPTNQDRSSMLTKGNANLCDDRHEKNKMAFHHFGNVNALLTDTVISVFWS